MPLTLLPAPLPPELKKKTIHTSVSKKSLHHTTLSECLRTVPYCFSSLCFIYALFP